MATIALTAAQISPAFPDEAEQYPMIALSAITAGQPVYIDTTTGKVAAADANAAGLQQVRGIAMNAGAAGEVIAVLKRGHVYGYTLTSQSYDDQIFLSDTVGVLGDAAGTMSVPVGRVVGLSDHSITKVIYFDIEWNVQWS